MIGSHAPKSLSARPLRPGPNDGVRNIGRAILRSAVALARAVELFQSLGVAHLEAHVRQSPLSRLRCCEFLLPISVALQLLGILGSFNSRHGKMPSEIRVPLPKEYRKSTCYSRGICSSRNHPHLRGEVMRCLMHLSSTIPSGNWTCSFFTDTDPKKRVTNVD